MIPLIGTNQPAGALSELLPWLLLLVGIVVAGAISVSVIRRWMKGGASQGQIGFSLSDLRQMHAEGRLSREELEKAEKHLVDRVRSSMTPEDLARRDEIRGTRRPSPTRPDNPTPGD